jgi:hypothetical protein
MGEVIPFISRAERERIRLIREARTNYESVFPSSDPLTERREAPQGLSENQGQNDPHRSRAESVSGACRRRAPYRHVAG